MSKAPAGGKPAGARKASAPVEESGAHTSPRVALPRGKPLTGEWLWTTRDGADHDLVEELALSLGPKSAHIEAPAIVRSHGAPTADGQEIDVVFARQGFHVATTIDGEPEVLASHVARVAMELAKDAERWSLSVFVPDTDAGNRLAQLADAVERDALATLSSLAPELATRHAAITRAAPGHGTLVQAALLSRGRIVVGSVPMTQAISLAPGGRARMLVGGDRPSRAARKVEEALAWLGVSPSAGEVCVDLGAAPGGWSWALLSRRARVIAVDPAELRPDVAAHRGLTHVKQSAFTYAPEEPVDWLFCDMAWRPLEAAQLLAKWGRRRWARFLVANLKLPMKTKARTVMELREVVHGGGWQRVRARQLYHDREEITLTAYR